MTSFKERIIETIVNDLEQIKSLDNPKLIKKECAQLLKRIEDAKKLLTNDERLLALEKKIHTLKN